MMFYFQNICGKYNDRKTLPSNHLKSFVNFIIMNDFYQIEEYCTENSAVRINNSKLTITQQQHNTLTTNKSQQRTKRKEYIK